MNFIIKLKKIKMMKENILFLVEKKGETQLIGSPIKIDSFDKYTPPLPRSKSDNFMEYLDESSEEIKEDTIKVSVVKEEQINDGSYDSEKYNEESEGNSGEKEEFNTGRWNEEEHKKFIEAILQYGNEWKRVQQYIKTRSSTQARSHAQKFFIRLKTKLGANNISLDNVDDQDSDKKQKFFDSIYYLLNQCLCENGPKNGDKIDSLMKEKFSTHGRDKLIKMIFNFHTKSGDYKRRKSSKTESFGDSNAEFSLAKQIQSCNLNDLENNLGYVKGFKLVKEEAIKETNDSNILSPKNSKLFKIEKNYQIKNRKKKTLDLSPKEFITSAYSNDLNSSYPNVCEISSLSASYPPMFNSVIVANSELSEVKNTKENVYEKLKSFFGLKLNEKKENPNPLWMNLIEENLNLDYHKFDHNPHNGNPFNINFENLDGCYCNNYQNGNRFNFEEDYINSHSNNMNKEIEKMFSNMVNFEFDYHNSFLNN